MKRQDILRINQTNWNQLVARGNRWTQPVDAETVQRAREGPVEFVLTPQKIVPPAWLPRLEGCETLLLAGGGGQQAPLLAAAGARVTVVDLSDAQLAQDQMVAQREQLELRTIQASIDDLSMLHDGEFELVINPCSNCFLPDLKPVWSEAARVTRQGGQLLGGFCNPLIFLFDEEVAAKGKLVAEYSIPYSDHQSLSPERFTKLQEEDEPLMFGHALGDQIGCLLQAGFAMLDMYEDTWDPPHEDGEKPPLSPLSLLDRHIHSFVAARYRRLPG